MIRWTQALPGQWDVAGGLTGTVPAGGPAYTAVGDGEVAVGMGQTVYAFSARNGVPEWQAALTGFPAAATIVSVRAWPGVVTVGVTAQGSRTEVVLSAVTGVPLGRYPAASFGGAITATAQYTVIVGTNDRDQL